MEEKGVNQSLATNKTTINKTLPPQPPKPPVTPIDRSNIKYKNASKKPLDQIIKDAIPKEAIPTKKTGYALGAIIIIVILIGIFQFPLGKMISGTTDIRFGIGMPWEFFVLNLMHPEEVPIKIGGLLGDMLIYVLIGYIIDVIINIIINASLFESKEEKKKHPGHYKNLNKRNNVAQRVTKATFQNNPQVNPQGQVNNTNKEATPQTRTTIKTTSEMLPPEPTQPQVIKKSTVKKTTSEMLPPKPTEEQATKIIPTSQN